MTIDSLAPVPSGVGRRTLLGAAWSAPVILAAVGAPLAAASDGGLTATLTWVDPPGVQKESSLLLLTLKPGVGGAPVVRGTGTLTLTVVEGYAEPAKHVVAPSGWTVSKNGRSITIVAPPGVTAGAKGFNVEFGELSGNWTTLATWTESGATGSVTSSIEVGPRGFPTMAWTTNPAVHGGTSTLRLTVPSNSYALGYQGVLIITPLSEDSVVTLPSGWTFEEPYLGGQLFSGPLTTAGTFDFPVAFAAGTETETVNAQWIAPSAPGATPATARPVLQLGPA
jgi:hypothetical protein